MRLAFTLGWVVATSGCAGWGCSPPFRDCPSPGADELAALPQSLSATGLYADAATGALAEDVMPFVPRFELWSDGASKRRWMYLPPGGVIDTADADAWNFPEGTKLWKEFTRGDVRVETRLLSKVGPAAEDWVAAAYTWRTGDAWLSVNGEENANGTVHDVPGAAQCWGCHGGTRSGVLGVSTVQLPAVGVGSYVGLAQLAESGRFSEPLPSANVPGDGVARAALGYLHANCSHCHNARRPEREGGRCFDPENDLDFALHTAELGALSVTGTYRTAVGKVITPGDAENSEVLTRMLSRDIWWGMPALGSEDVDAAGVTLVQRWILRL